MKIKYTKQALKALRAYDKSTRQLIRGKIKDLTETPPKGDIKSLQGSKTKKRLRIGSYRVVFEYIVEDKVKFLMINIIDTRGGVYK